MLQVGEPEDGRCRSWHLIRYNHDDDVDDDNHDNDVNDDNHDDINDDNHDDVVVVNADYVVVVVDDSDGVIKLDDADGGDDVWVISKHGKKVPS